MSSSSKQYELLSGQVGYGESPGRLDFMGGVADYSGSMVLEMPIKGKTRVEITYQKEPLIILHSIGFDQHHFHFKVLRSLLIQYISATHTKQHKKPNLTEEAAFLSVVKQHLDDEVSKAKTPSWCKYVIGCIVVFCARKGWIPATTSLASSSSSSAPLGLNVTVSSAVNASMGVSSSAAIEIATIRAISSLAQHTMISLTGEMDESLTFTGTELAQLGQLAENRIVGAPCGLMDQLSVAYGEPSHILPILCRPDILYDNIALPAGVVVVGWPSGIKHSVGESPYSMARAGAFMGKRIMETLVGQTVKFAAEFSPSQILAPNNINNKQQEEHSHDSHDSHAHSASSAQNTRLSVLPVSMLGADFISQYQHVDDPLTKIKPDLYYPVKDAFNFPIQENFRCQLAASLLSAIHQLPKEQTTTTASFTSNTSAASSPSLSRPSLTRANLLSQLGELLYQSHRGYSLMGLGCPETDQMIAILQTLKDEGVYGGRISGGGSGGTVVVLCEESAVPIVRQQLKKFPSSSQLDLILG